MADQFSVMEKTWMYTNFSRNEQVDCLLLNFAPSSRLNGSGLEASDMRSTSAIRTWEAFK